MALFAPIKGRVNRDLLYSYSRLSFSTQSLFLPCQRVGFDISGDRLDRIFYLNMDTGGVYERGWAGADYLIDMYRK